MLSNLSDATLLRIIIGLAFVLIIVFILVSSKSKKSIISRNSATRTEPRLDADAQLETEQVAIFENNDYKEQASLGLEQKSDPDRHSHIGIRQTEEYEKLVMLYLAAKSGQTISGAELVLATEKVGLTYGHHNIYHRLAESSHSNEPVFSMANVIQPGYFDLHHIDTLQTPGVSFFMTLPGPVTAVQAWDTMLPIAERMAQLLDGVLLDSDRNALGRQRILHIKEDLRSFDRDKERQMIKPGR